MWETTLDHSPFDVVAWRGNYVPSKYDMTRFMVLGALSFDHAEPSIYCALTSPSNTVAGGNADFMILPPSWLVAEHTFRPPTFHRNAVAEFLAVVRDNTERGYSTASRNAGSASLHNPWAPHGPDVALLEAGRTQVQSPMRFEGLFFMIESRFPFSLTDAGREAQDPDYVDKWKGFKSTFKVDATE